MQTKHDEEFNQWFSTYGVITSERILGTYQITIPGSQLVMAIKNPSSFYHLLLQMPLKNILNGIVMQQANDYQIYIQKLFIDYLLSGESGKDPEAQGALTREKLEEERQKLVELGTEFHEKEIKHSTLIAESQAALKGIVSEWKAALEISVKQVGATLKRFQLESKKSEIRHAIIHGLVHCETIHMQDKAREFAFIESVNQVLKHTLHDEMKKQLLSCFAKLSEVITDFRAKVPAFIEAANELNLEARSYRTQFYEATLRVLELIKMLPDYKIDPAQDKINRELLYFDKTIGMGA